MCWCMYCRAWFDFSEYRDQSGCKCTSRQTHHPRAHFSRGEENHSYKARLSPKASELFYRIPYVDVRIKYDCRVLNCNLVMEETAISFQEVKVISIVVGSFAACCFGRTKDLEAERNDEQHKGSSPTGGNVGCRPHLLCPASRVWCRASCLRRISKTREVEFVKS